MQPEGAIPARRADIDSLRVLALLLLITYHVLLVYSGRDFWRVVSGYNGFWADYLITLLRPWRITLVFLIGGVAVRFMLDRLEWRRFVFDRVAKLGAAFMFAVTVLVPVQRYVRLDDLGLRQPGYGAYLLNEAWRVDVSLGVPLPEFSHAWFLLYLLVYSILAGLAWRYAPRAFGWAIDWAGRAPILLLVGATLAWFACLSAFVDPAIRPTNMLINDVSGHLRYAPIFFLGVLLGKRDAFWRRLDIAKWRLWFGSALLAPLNVGLLWLVLHGRLADPMWWNLARGAFGGVTLFGVVAFGHAALNKPSQLLTFAADAILPVYLMHQSFLVVAGDAIVARHWPAPVEAGVLVAAALLAPLAIYCVFIRRVPLMRVLIGLRPHLRR